MDDPSAAIQPLLRAQHVRVNFGRLRAVDDVSLDVQAGQLVGIIGPNGAGKTTLLRALAGMQVTDGGHIEVLGETLEPGGSPPVRHIGFTADTPPLYEQLTVRQYLEFIARGYDIWGHEIHERIDFWLEKVWLAEKADQRINQLSRGMRQRVGIARTLLPNPAIILLDEPAAGLDPAGRVQFRELLVNLREQQKAIVVSSHILSDMSQFCTHIAIMASGKIVHYGTVAEIAGSGNGQRHRYTMTLTRPVAGMDRKLADLNLVDVHIDNDRVTFEYASDRESAAALLQTLIERRIPVASFAPHAAGLEEAYLRTGIRQVD